MSTTGKNYHDLILLPTFEERFMYLKLNNIVGQETFGSARFLNQSLYQSSEWKKARRDVILRDKGCDLAIEGLEIKDRIYVHHIQPLTYEDVLEAEDWIFDPTFLICCSYATHEALHYGKAREFLGSLTAERKPGDTLPYGQNGSRGVIL